MSARAIQIAWTAAGAAIFVAALAYPGAALLMRAVGGAPTPPELTGFSASLFWRTVALAAGGALAAVLLALPGAFAAARLGRRPRDAATAALILAPMLFPAMVYAFGWQKLLPGWGLLQCVWVWATWSWPIAALVLGAGWMRLGRRRYEEALLSAGPMRAFIHAVLPLLWRHLVVCLLILFALFMGDYAVPHACGLVVYATELVLAAQASPDPRATLVASWPVAAVIVAALASAGWTWRRQPEGEDAAGDLAAVGSPWSFGLALILATGCVAVPLVALGRSVSLGAALSETVRTYGAEIVASMTVALASGVLAVVMGAALAALPGIRWIALAWGVLWMALPGALVGAAMVAAYLPIPAVYDHAGMLVLGYVARFGWIGILAGWLALASVEPEQVQAARADGASRWLAGWRIALGSNLPTLLCGIFVVFALSLSEAAATALIRVPTVNPVALILIEKFHRFEDGILVSLCLLMTAATIPGAVLAGWVARRWRG